MATSLACEGVFHPAELNTGHGPAVRYLPAPLIRARAEALNPRNCLDLSRTARHALYGILAFLDVRKPAEPVFASREKLCAEALLGSQPTLYRALADLVSRGYIRREQSRRRARETYGQYSVSRIWLEEKTLRLLGLLNGENISINPVKKSAGRQHTEEGADRNKESFPQRPSLTVKDRLQENELTPSKQLSLKEQPPQKKSIHQEEGRGGETFGNIDKKTRLPKELIRLMAIGLSKSRICALMKLARQYGNGGRLGAVVSLVWDRIRKLNSNSAFAYLAKLVQQRKDYGRLVELQDQYDDKDRMPTAVIERYNEKRQVFLERAKGMVVVSRDGIVLGPVHHGQDGAAWLEFVGKSGVRCAQPVNIKFIRDWEEGILVLRNPDNIRALTVEYDEYAD